jgi:hypothetical protein
VNLYIQAVSLTGFYPICTKCYHGIFKKRRNKVETWKVILIIAIVLGVVWSNIALLKYSAKFEMKRLNQDPLEKAKASLKEKESTEDKEKNTKNPHQ